MLVGIIGLGFIGQLLAVALKNDDYRTFGTTTSPEKASYLSTFVDNLWVLSKEQTLSTFIPQVDVLVIAVAPKQGMSYEDTYLSVAKEVYKSHPKQVIYISSTSVYGDYQGREVDEKSVLHGNRVLIETEELLLKLQCPITIFRLGGIYGEGRTFGKGTITTFSGSGDSRLNMIHAKDVVKALLFAIKNPIYGVYNLVNDGHPTRREFYGPNVEFTGTSREDKIVSNTKIKVEGFTFDYPSY